MNARAGGARRRGTGGLALTGRAVLVTGGGSGIGRLMALGAAQRGARVVIWDRDPSAAARVSAEIGAAGGEASHAVVDVTDTTAVAREAATLEPSGGVDVLVNNAGIVTAKGLLEASEAEIRRTYEVNALAPYWTTRAFLPGMEARGRGRVVTIASAAALVGVARQTDYAASKSAAFGFTEALRAELRTRRSPVSTLVVCPYYIDTGMFSGVRTRVPWLLPILREGEVAEKVLDAVESGRQVLMLPPVVRTLPLLRALPTRAFDVVMDVLGINATMDHVTGRGTPSSPGGGPDTT